MASLAGGTAATVGGDGSLAAAIVVGTGPQAFYERDAIRIAVTLLLIAALLVLAAFTFQAGAWSRRPAGRGPLDERDRAILELAPRLEGGPMLVTLALWLVGLQQAFWGVGAVPLVYLVCRLRFSHGELTQQELADRVGCTRQTILLLEQGRYTPSLALAMRIARVFGRRVEEVFQLEQEGRPA